MGRRLRRCLECGYTTAYHSSMQNHQRIHTGERPHKCDYCGKAFMQKGNLVAHLRIHTGERPFHCHLCPMAFTQKINLVSHMRTHMDKKQFQCRFCLMVFEHKLLLQNHEMTHFSSVEVCVLRALIFCRSHSYFTDMKHNSNTSFLLYSFFLILHRQQSSSPHLRHYSTFATAVILKAMELCQCITRRQHSAQERVDDFSVKRVGQYFPLAEDSRADLCPSENVDLELHLCRYCNKSFATRGNLNAHLRIHTGERPFQCHLCPRAFTQKATLVHHVRTHTGERPYQCRFCPMAFARKLPCRYHELRRHPKGTAAP
ncbi:zinc finger protein 674-like [Dermacentor albipictus]|uniref:zinc finger protein 674-like n=1 Tax=Dermacentor albipictus TaxID=60249 RepID=UPI0038FCCC0B